MTPTLNLENLVVNLMATGGEKFDQALKKTLDNINAYSVAINNQLESIHAAMVRLTASIQGNSATIATMSGNVTRLANKTTTSVVTPLKNTTKAANAATPVVQQTGQAVQQLGHYANGASSSLSRLRTILAFGFIAGGFMALRNAATQVGDFEQEMANTMSMMDQGTSQIQAHMEQVALDVSTRSITGPVALAKAYMEMSKAGLDAAQSTNILAIAERFAFVNSLPVEQAVRDIVRMQRAMGQLMDDPMQNARNFERFGNIITSVANRAGVETGAFMHALSRLGPHLKFLNKDLEEGAALIAAYTSRGIEAAAAGQMSRQILQNLGRLFIRSEMPPSVMRGAHEDTRGRMPSGSFITNRMFNVHPLHDADSAVRQATHSWRSYGIEVFHTTGALMGQMHTLPHIINQLDTLLATLGTAEEKQRVLMRLGFQEEAARSTITLLGSGRAMEEFMMQARDADGLLDQIAGHRLQTMNSQLRILTNNVTVVAIEFGRVLVPYLRAANQVIIDLVRAWLDIPDAARIVYMRAMLLVGAFAILTVALPGLVVLFNYLKGSTQLIGQSIYNTIIWIYSLGVQFVTTASAIYTFLKSINYLAIGTTVLRYSLLALVLAWEVLTTAWSISFAIATTLTSIYQMQFVIAAALIPIYNTIVFVVGIMSSAYAFLAGVISSLVAVWNFLTASWTLSFLVAGLVMLAWKGLLILAGLLGTAYTFLIGVIDWLAVNMTIANGVMLLVAAAQLIQKGATWLLTAAWTAFSVVLKYVLAITGLIIVSFALLVATMLVVIAVANVAWVGLLFILQGIFAAVVAIGGALFRLAPGEGFRQLWDGFIPATQRAFWLVTGFFVNFRENMNRITDWLDKAWPDIMFNMANIGTIAFNNMWENIKIGWSKLLVVIMEGLISLIGFIARVALAIQNPIVALRDGPQLLRDMNAQAVRVGEQAGRPVVPLLQGMQLRKLPEFPGMNLDIPENVRNRIEEFGRRVRNMFTGEEIELRPGEHGGQVGTEFKEISLSRFVLDSVKDTATANKKPEVSAPGVETRLDDLLELIRRGGLGVGPVPAAI